MYNQLGQFYSQSLWSASWGGGGGGGGGGGAKSKIVAAFIFQNICYIYFNKSKFWNNSVSVL